MRVSAAVTRELKLRLHVMAFTLLLGTLTSCGGSDMSSSMPPPPSGGGGSSHTPTQPTDVVTYKNDVGRTGANVTESVLTPANVNSSSFGKLRTLDTDGKVDAQPLYLSGLAVQGAAHNVVFVATENDTLYAFDADTGAVLWQKSLLGSGETPSEAVHSCSQVTPMIGITATPVIDRSAGAHGTIYVVAMSKTTSPLAYHQRLHALDVTTRRGAAQQPDGSDRHVSGDGRHDELRSAAVRGARGAAAVARDPLHQLDFTLRRSTLFGLGDRVQPGHAGPDGRVQRRAQQRRRRSGDLDEWRRPGRRRERRCLPAHRERRLRDHS